MTRLKRILSLVLCAGLACPPAQGAQSGVSPRDLSPSSQTDEILQAQVTQLADRQRKIQTQMKERLAHIEDQMPELSQLYRTQIERLSRAQHLMDEAGESLENADLEKAFDQQSQFFQEATHVFVEGINFFRDEEEKKTMPIGTFLDREGDQVRYPKEKKMTLGRKPFFDADKFQKAPVITHSYKEIEDSDPKEDTYLEVPEHLKQRPFGQKQEAESREKSPGVEEGGAPDGGSRAQKADAKAEEGASPEPAGESQTLEQEKPSGSQPRAQTNEPAAVSPRNAEVESGGGGAGAGSGASGGTREGMRRSGDGENPDGQDAVPADSQEPPAQASSAQAAGKALESGSAGEQPSGTSGQGPQASGQTSGLASAGNDSPGSAGNLDSGNAADQEEMQISGTAVEGEAGASGLTLLSGSESEGDGYSSGKSEGGGAGGTMMAHESAASGSGAAPGGMPVPLAFAVEGPEAAAGGSEVISEGAQSSSENSLATPGRLQETASTPEIEGDQPGETTPPAGKLSGNTEQILHDLVTKGAQEIGSEAPEGQSDMAYQGVIPENAGSSLEASATTGEALQGEAQKPSAQSSLAYQGTLPETSGAPETATAAGPGEQALLPDAQHEASEAGLPPSDGKAGTTESQTASGDVLPPSAEVQENQQAAVLSGEASAGESGGWVENSAGTPDSQDGLSAENSSDRRSSGDSRGPELSGQEAAQSASSNALPAEADQDSGPESQSEGREPLMNDEPFEEVVENEAVSGQAPAASPGSASFAESLEGGTAHDAAAPGPEEAAIPPQLSQTNLAAENPQDDLVPEDNISAVIREWLIQERLLIQELKKFKPVKQMNNPNPPWEFYLLRQRQMVDQVKQLRRRIEFYGTKDEYFIELRKVSKIANRLLELMNTGEYTEYAIAGTSLNDLLEDIRNTEERIQNKEAKLFSERAVRQKEIPENYRSMVDRYFQRLSEN